jgi:O-antigen/teichoic acid export membrane protein
MFSVSGFSHSSRAVRAVCFVGLVCALGLLLLSWGASRFPGTAHAAPLQAWFIAVAAFCAIASFVTWFQSPALAVVPTAAFAATATLVVIAGFPYSPLVWGSAISVGVMAWWLAAGRFRK